jgi:hypothetical protein
VRCIKTLYGRRRTNNTSVILRMFNAG